MRYLLAYLVASVLVTAILYGCSNTTDTFPQKSSADAETDSLYQDAQERFLLRYPADWLIVQADESDETIHFVNLSLEDSNERVIVTITVQDAAQDLDTVADAAERFIQTQRGITNFARVYQADISVNGLRGIEHTVNYTLFEEQMAQRMVYLTHPESHTFAITMTATKTKLPKYAGTFGEILNSFDGM